MLITPLIPAFTEPLIAPAIDVPSLVNVFLIVFQSPEKNEPKFENTALTPFHAAPNVSLKNEPTELNIVLTAFQSVLK